MNILEFLAELRGIKQSNGEINKFLSAWNAIECTWIKSDLESQKALNYWLKIAFQEEEHGAVIDPVFVGKFFVSLIKEIQARDAVIHDLLVDKGDLMRVPPDIVRQDNAKLMARIARLEKTNAHLKQCYKDKTGESIPFNFAELCDSE